MREKNDTTESITVQTGTPEKTGKTDTMKLLRKCEEGCYMGIQAIDDVLDEIQEKELEKLLTEAREHHEKIRNKIHHFLREWNYQDKEPGMLAKIMSFMKTTIKIHFEKSDTTIAGLMIDGCHMGLKSLHKYKNKYQNADSTAVEICNRLLDIEDELCHKLYTYV